MSNPSTLDRLLARISPEPNSGCWLWDGGAFDNGYGAMWLRVGEVPGFRQGNAAVHRLSFVLHKGAIPWRKIVCHKCDVPLCVNPDDLYAGTYADNARDMMQRGRQGNCTPHRICRGEANGNSKLLPDTVLAIYRSRGYQRDVARQYGVSQALVWNIRNHRTWTHITRPEAA